MGLPSSPFAYDTETDRIDPDDPETTYCCLVQICPADAAGLKDVVLFESDDAITDFLRAWEDTSHNCEMHCFNLGNYEFEWLRGGLIAGGYSNVEWTKAKKIKKHAWRVMYDVAGVFKMQISNQDGYLLTIRDDMKIFDPSVSMATLADSIRMDHPDWWPSETVKESVDRYNDGWHFRNNNREEFLSYSRLDAYSQAMILRYLIENGMSHKLSAAGFGLEEALGIKYGKENWINRKNFTAEYPPLSAEMQEIAEGSMLAGFVYGLVGTFCGNFTKLDYKSSYPAEYDHGRMFKGRVRRIRPDHEKYARIRGDPQFVRWYVVSFDFELREGMLPCINAKETGSADYVNLKMRKGRVEKRLYLDVYLMELQEHYEFSNVEIHEMWYARKITGGFSDVIAYNFNKKEKSRKKSPAYRKAKLNMNGGIHGKTITKTKRKHRVFEEDGTDPETKWMETESDPTFCFMVGFTAMQNARKRLLGHCRLLIENGFKIYMCDTDSLITDAPLERCREILGDAMIKEGDKEMKDILGKFELEAVFDTFKCWGLKRYCELDKGKFIGSAFAGMHDDIQAAILPEWETDGTVYGWKQLTKMRLTTHYGVTLVETTKHAGARNIWWEEWMSDKSMRRLMGLGSKYGEDYVQSYLDDLARKLKPKDYTEDMVAYLKDCGYAEIDPYWRHHVREAYDECKRREADWYGDN